MWDEFFTGFINPIKPYEDEIEFYMFTPASYKLESASAFYGDGNRQICRVMLSSLGEGATCQKYMNLT